MTSSSLIDWNFTADAAAVSSGFDPTHVNLETADPRDVVCFLSAMSSESAVDLQAARISSIFIVLVVSTMAAMFPILASRSERLKIRKYVYLTVRYFGAGVIIATAFIHLLDPAYGEIGPNTCVGMTGAWAGYSWPPAIAMTSAMCVFLLDFLVECYVQSKRGVTNKNVHGDVEAIVTIAEENLLPNFPHSHPAEQRYQEDEESSSNDDLSTLQQEVTTTANENVAPVVKERSFEEQIGGFLVLELGVILHSIIIGLNLGVAESEFRSLYPVLVFHQSFEGMGIGARLSDIPFPRRFRIVPWVFCIAFGLTTPVAISIGSAVRSSYRPDSFTASVVSGVLDSISAGILLYTGFVELLARDFLFYPERSRDKVRVTFMIVCLYLGIALMGLLGKWA